MFYQVTNLPHLNNLSELLAILNIINQGCVSRKDRYGRKFRRFQIEFNGNCDELATIVG